MGSRAVLRFYAELNDFLPPEKRQTAFSHFFFGQPAVKDMIESVGVPHTEVDLIIVDDTSVDFNYRVKDGDRIGVYPMFEAFDISPVLKVRPDPLRIPRFVLDTHLGKLANYLCMLGFDALYRNNFEDDTLADISANNKRILLTRDRGLLKRSIVTHGYLLRTDHSREQLKEVLQRFDLLESIKPFSRCMRCNAVLESVDFDKVKGKVPPRVRQNIREYKQCQSCGQVYWKGTHYREMVEFINQLIAEQKPNPGKH